MPEMLKKISPSLQINESVNSVIGTKCLKKQYYRGSESKDFRVATGVAQTNKGNPTVSLSIQNRYYLK